MSPRRGHCRGCGAPVIFVQSDDEGLLVLDVHESVTGPERYAIYDDGSVHPVGRRAAVRANPRHHCGTLHTAH
jgi:hypothetical protein